MPKAINPFSKRKSSSPFSNAQRKKPGVQKSGLAGKTDDEERLEDIGRISALAHVNVDQDVVSLLRHVRSHTFEEIPTRGAGMNSTQISGTFRFRAALPPIVSIAHLHALSRSTTETERELAQVIAAGKIRKVAIPGRGKGGSAVGDGVVLVEDWKQSLYQETALEDQIKEKYVALMDAHPGSATAPMSGLTDVEIQSLVSTGFLTNPAALTSGLGNLFAKTSTAADGTIAKSGYSGATGTLAAIGGHDAIHASGGSGSTLATKDNRGPGIKLGEQMTFSLPSTGSYLKFLIEARLHFLYLLRQLSPRYKEATKEMLEEKWNGNVPNDPISKQKRMRGEWSGVLPGKTKRWRDFYGLEFDWVLAECVGSGLVELFDTGSVGTAMVSNRDQPYIQVLDSKFEGWPQKPPLVFTEPLQIVRISKAAQSGGPVSQSPAPKWECRWCHVLLSSEIFLVAHGQSCRKLAAEIERLEAILFGDIAYQVAREPEPIFRITRIRRDALPPPPSMELKRLLLELQVQAKRTMSYRQG